MARPTSVHGAVAVALQTFVLGTAPTLGNTTTTNGSSSSDAVSTPTGTGGILVASITVFNHTTASSGAATVSGGTGTWTLRSYAATAVSGNGVASWIYTKPSAGEGGTLSYTASAAGGNYYAFGVTRLTHGSGTPTFDAAGTPIVTAAGGTARSIPAVTTTNAARLIAFCSGEFGTWSSATGFTSIAAWVSQNLWHQAVTPNGTYGPSAVTYSSGATEACVVHCIAIGPP